MKGREQSSRGNNSNRKNNNDKPAGSRRTNSGGGNYKSDRGRGHSGASDGSFSNFFDGDDKSSSPRRGDSRPRNNFGDKPFKKDNDRPFKKEGNRFSDKPRSNEERGSFDKPFGKSSERSFDKPRRNDDFNASERPAGRTSDRSFDKPRRDDDFNASDRPARRTSDRSFERPRRDDDFNASDRPARRTSDRSFDRPRRDSDFNSSERSPRRSSDRSFENKRFDEEGNNDSFERPSRERSFDRSEGRGSSRYGDKPSGRRSKPFSRNNDDRSSNNVYAAPSSDGTIRLNRYISNAGICSRREADELITTGVITVNGKIITDLGTKVKLTDVVLMEGQKISQEKKVYVLLNKPKDYITTAEDPEDRKTVMHLIKDAGRERLYPVGRLDRNTTGVLLMTNDGELTKKLTHPKYQQRKLYHVFLDKPLTKADFESIEQGVELEDGFIKVDNIDYVAKSSTFDEVGLEIHSGRNRIVRRIFENLGYRVVKLDRVMFAGLTKKDLPRGRWRYLTPAEVSMLYAN